ncbi:FAD binding domain [Fusarium albosuccineum]|uniref:FAD binding domain n=1 Tax=Fusarium albosuccineum TaxID=1237068 RepID=A0A8H4PGH5_9HYPO|nr:FAD binding domain [Fusarium albosuccineum]
MFVNQLLIAIHACGLIDAPPTKEALKQMTRPLGKVFNGPGMHAVYALTPDRLSLTLIHPDDGTSRETWSSNINVAQMKAVFDSAGVTWDPLLAEAMGNLPQGRLTRWQICWRDPQAKWTSVGGHVVQIGDAAHACLPSAANGASMAMEDAQSIAECLRLGGKGRVNLATKVHELLRYQRTALVQRCGFANKSALHDNTMEDIVASDRKPLDYGKWLWAHNAERYATENFDLALASLVSGNPFENTNLPPGHQFEDWDVGKEETGACKFATKDLRSNGDWGCVSVGRCSK